MSTPALSLLVALVSVVGVNAIAVLEFFFPERAQIVVSAMALDAARVRLSAVNVSQVDAQLGEELKCFGENGWLDYTSAVPISLAAGMTVNVELTPAGSYKRFIQEIENGEVPTGDMRDWVCNVDARDASGRVEDIVFKRPILRAVIQERGLANVRFTDHATLN